MVFKWWQREKIFFFVLSYSKKDILHLHENDFLEKIGDALLLSDASDVCTIYHIGMHVEEEEDTDLLNRHHHHFYYHHFVCLNNSYFLDHFFPYDPNNNNPKEENSRSYNFHIYYDQLKNDCCLILPLMKINLYVHVFYILYILVMVVNIIIENSTILKLKIFLFW